MSNKQTFIPAPEWKKNPHEPPIVVTKSEDSANSQDPFMWEYQWQDAITIHHRTVEPPLEKRIISEVLGGLNRQKGLLIFIRGELGIGKTTLKKILIEKLTEAGKKDSDTANRVFTLINILETNDLESSVEFAKRVNKVLLPNNYVVLLARPGTLDKAAQWINKSPDIIVTINTFEPTGLLFNACLEKVAVSSELHSKEQKEKLNLLAGNLPSFLQTPFYFNELANALKEESFSFENKAPLEIFQHSLEQRISGRGNFSSLVDFAFARLDKLIPISGIVDNNKFIHDGYRNVVLASAVLFGNENFKNLVLIQNVLPAIKIIIDHIKKEFDVNHQNSIPKNLLDDLKTFVLEEPDFDHVENPVFLQGLVSELLMHQEGNKRVIDKFRERCLELSKIRSFKTSGGKILSTSDLWWDLSDSLSYVKHPTLEIIVKSKYSVNSDYFTRVAEMEVQIGSEYIPERRDKAKPVLPYKRTKVSIGPMWVANYLVTNEQFREFLDNSGDYKKYFSGTGLQWVNKDISLLKNIEDSFEIVASRCFWKEIQGEEKVEIVGTEEKSVSILNLARLRALLQSEKIALWNPTQTDERFSIDGNPVVGVTWWEAMAFCNWWTSVKLKDSGFPATCIATLLADWEWEALRRFFYEDISLLDTSKVLTGRYPAHLRQFKNDIGKGRVNNVMRPLHVGLVPRPKNNGPFDLVGNVWEWTRSRVFGQIVKDEKDETFGHTTWDDKNETAERMPLHPLRDIIDEQNDLTYRAVRGGSFFSIDEQAAWHPAYRLCDPPYSSYFDLGFRFAVYEKG